MRKLALVLPTLLLIAALHTPGVASAATITASTATVGLGTSTISLTLDPEGASAGAWLVVLRGDGLTIDAIVNIVPAGTDCFGLNSTLSFDGQCAGSPLNSSAVVAQVTITALNVGDTLSLVSGNITDFNTFEDTAFTSGVLVTVVPEPGTALLMLGGLTGLAVQGRRVRPS